MDDSSKTSENNDKVSICDVLKSDTSEIIKKLESQTPSLFQNYTNLYTEYLHMLDDLFGTCYIAEKEFFDKLNIDPKVLTQIKKNSEFMKKNYVEYIEMNQKYWDEYFKTSISAVKSFDTFMHGAMDSYAHLLSQLNKSAEKYNKKTK